MALDAGAYRKRTAALVLMRGRNNSEGGSRDLPPSCLQSGWLPNRQEPIDFLVFATFSKQQETSDDGKELKERHLYENTKSSISKSTIRTLLIVIVFAPSVINALAPSWLRWLD